MKALIVVPARYASTRLPAKPLLAETGKTLIQHVYERAVLSRRSSGVLVATDDQRIFDAVRAFGGHVTMTRDDHASGTDRIAEVARTHQADIYVNLQGDEPLIDPACLDQVITLLADDPQANMATLATPLRTLEQYHSPHCVKVVCDGQGNALYFSRSPIPHMRDGVPDLEARPPLYFQHVGLYAYRRDFLLQLAALPPAPLERVEKLEQLRALAAGCRIRVGQTESVSLGVDTWEDYHRFVAHSRAASARPAA